MEFMTPLTPEARNQAEMAALRREAEELRSFLTEEEGRGRGMRPAAMNARARLRDVKRTISQAEQAARGGVVVQVQARQQAGGRREFMPTVPYWTPPGTARAVRLAANASGGSDDFAGRWAALYETARPGERAFRG